MSIPEPPEPTNEAELRRQVRLARVSFAVTAAIAVALGAVALVSIRGGDDDSDDSVAEQTERTTTTEREAEPDPDEEDPLANLLDDLDALDDLSTGGASLECLGRLEDLIGGDRIELPDDPREQYEAVARAVEEERELTFEQIPEPIFVTQDEMQERLRKLVERDYPADVARADEELLIAYGTLEPGTDLREENVKLLGDQVAGYYDLQTKELVVLGDDGEPFDAIELTIIAHELEHALADQTLDLPIDENPNTDDPDAAAAARALIEGDAVLTQTNFQLRAIDPLELLTSSFSGDVAASQEALDAAPPFLAKQLLFPYEDGLAFVCERQQDGWSAVDDLYRKPPTTTAQIMFPERYDAGEGAVDAPDPVKPDGAGWEEVRHQTFGAADLMFLLDLAGVDAAREKAAAWAGGEVTQWRRGDETAVRVSLVRRDESDGLCESVTAWVETLDDAAVECDGSHIDVAL